MLNETNQEHIYQIGHITFIVTPVYQSGQGENVLSILLKLMKSDVGQQ
jgi:hypothetical protein